MIQSVTVDIFIVSSYLATTHMPGFSPDLDCFKTSPCVSLFHCARYNVFGVKGEYLNHNIKHEKTVTVQFFDLKIFPVKKLMFKNIALKTISM